MWFMVYRISGIAAAEAAAVYYLLNEMCGGANCSHPFLFSSHNLLLRGDFYYWRFVG